MMNILLVVIVIPSITALLIICFVLLTRIQDLEHGYEYLKSVHDIHSKMVYNLEQIISLVDSKVISLTDSCEIMYKMIKDEV